MHAHVYIQTDIHKYGKQKNKDAQEKLQKELVIGSLNVIWDTEVSICEGLGIERLVVFFFF